MNLLAKQSQAASMSRYFLIFTLVVIVLILNGIPYYTQHGLSELIAPLKYISDGQTSIQTDLYISDVNTYKSRIPFIQFYSEIQKIIDVPSYFFDHINFVLTSVLTYAAIFGMLVLIGLPIELAIWSALGFILFNPFRAIYYGYHYKIGSAGATIGIIAFTLVTILFYFFQSKKLILHLVFLACLYFVHPLNALLYAGFLGFYLLINSILNRSISPDFKFILASIILVCGLFYLTMDDYLASAGQDKDKIFILISIINSPGGYFFSWFDPQRLIQAVVFFPTFIILAMTAYKKSYLSRDQSNFFVLFSVYSFILCMLNVIAYYARINFLLPLDISRVFALQIPLAYILSLCVLYQTWKQEKNLQMIGLAALLLVSIRFNIIFFPFFVVYTLFTPEKNIRKLLAVFVVLLVVILSINIDASGIEFSKSLLIKSKVSFLMLVFISVVVLFYPFLRKSVLLGYVALSLSALILCNRYYIEFKTMYEESQSNDQTFSSLISFINDNSKSTDVVLSEDYTLNRLNIRPTLVDFSSLAYGIYVGNLMKLEDEAKLVWNIEFTPEYLTNFLNNKSENELRIDMQMRAVMKKYTADQIKAIKGKYPNFKYILIENDSLPFQNKLPIQEVYTNDRFSLFEVAIN